MITVTSIGYEKITAELEKLKKIDRIEIVALIEHIRTNGGGDLLENNEFTDAQNQQMIIENRIQYLESVLSNINVVDPIDFSGHDRVIFGATVKLVDEDTDQESSYKLVSEFESDAKAGLISVSSPIGKALIGKKVGESVIVITPKTEKYFEILDISFQ